MSGLRFNTRGRVVVSRAAFASMKVVPYSTSGIATYRGTRCRALVGGRWHVLQKHWSFGVPVVSAFPLTIRLTASDLQECAA